MPTLSGNVFQDLTIYVNHKYGWKEAFRKVARAFPNKKVILTEGDSWFAYPSTFNRPNGNVISWLERQLENGIQKHIFLRLESNGDEAMEMLQGTSRSRLLEVIDYKPVKERLNLILFSGGGNDIVGKGDMNRFLDIHNNDPITKYINVGNYLKMLESINAAYSSLIRIRNENIRNIPIITHTYSYLIPSDIGFNFPPIYKGKAWMKPYMDFAGIRNSEDQIRIAKYFIDEFHSVLTGLAQRNKDFHLLDNRSKLPNRNQWINEIHPTSKNFKIIADSFLDKMNNLGI